VKNIITPDNKHWLIALFCLIPLAILQSMIRFHYLDIPLFTDFSVYAYIGHALGDGGLLYTSLVDNKPPAIYLTYMLAEKLFGYQQSTIILLGVIFSSISLVFLFFLLRRLGGVMAAVIGSIFWVLISSTPALHAELPNTELFINTFILIAFWAFLGHLDGKKGYLYITGSAMAIASYYKMNAVFVLAALLVYLLIHEMRGKERFGVLKKSIIQLILPIVLLWSVTFIYFGITNRFNDMHAVLFDAVRQYAGNIWLNEWTFLKTFRLLFIAPLKELWILITLAYFWIISIFIFKSEKRFMWLIYWLAGTLIMIGSMRVSSPHYYQVLFPVICVLGALFFKRIVELMSNLPKAKWVLSGLILLVSVGVAGYNQIGYLKTTPEEIAIEKYGYSPRDDRTLGLILKSLTRPEETIYQWGLAPSIYFYSQRKAASGYLLNQVFYFAPEPIVKTMYAKLVKDVRESRPVFLIFTSWNIRLSDEPLLQVVKKDYSFFGLYGKYVIFERKNRTERFEEVLQTFRDAEEPKDRPWEDVQLRLADQTIQLASFRNMTVSFKPFERELLMPDQNTPQKELVMQGIELYKKNDLRGAEQLLRKITDEDKSNFTAMANLGLMYEQFGLYYRALANYQSVAIQYGHPWSEYYQESRFSLCREAERIVSEDK